MPPPVDVGLVRAGDRWGLLARSGLAGLGGADRAHGGAPEALDLIRTIEAVEAEPVRWVVFEARPVLLPLVTGGLRISRCWDLAEAHRLLDGGWQATPESSWARARGLDPAGMPTRARGDLFDALLDPAPGDDPDAAVLASGYLRPDAFGDWGSAHPEHLFALADAALAGAAAQRDLLEALARPDDPSAGRRAVATAVAESAAAVLCVELEAVGLPVDRAALESLVAVSAGPRPRDAQDADRIRAKRDARVLASTGTDARWAGSRVDLRNPGQVRQLLAAAGVEVPNTRKWTLEPYRATHPLVAALLDWRRDERIATTYGYRWIDEHIGSDDRLRGRWTACDGAAGRMTAGSGLHNLPAGLRPGVAAEPGHVFIRADLGQIEPRVLAAVSGDPAFMAATREDDLYAPVAARLGVDRPTAKIAVLAAMYGQRSGAAGEALKGLERAYPVAMGLLDDAYRSGLAGQSVRTFGGRLIRLTAPPPPDGPEGDSGDEPLGPGGSSNSGGPGSSGEGSDGYDAAVGSDGPTLPAGPMIAAARGRYARNAIIQGAAAELFKAWAATVRHEVSPLEAQIVLCLHDELLVQVPADRADRALDAVHRALADASRRWLGHDGVRFVADALIVQRWSEAKESKPTGD